MCKEESSFFSNAKLFIDMPRIKRLLEDDMAKYGIPDNSSKKNYQKLYVCFQSLEKLFPPKWKCLYTSWHLSWHCNSEHKGWSIEVLWPWDNYWCAISDSGCFLSLQIINKYIPVLETYLLDFLEHLVLKIYLSDTRLRIYCCMPFFCEHKAVVLVCSKICKPSG